MKRSMPLPFSPDQWTPCQTSDPELFFPEPKRQTGKEAKGLCAECPLTVFAACLDYALTNPVEGIWGGTSEKQRRNLKRNRRAA